MSLHALQIPDEPADLPQWLEGYLVGLDLAQLVAELAAVHPPQSKPVTLETVVGKHLPEVLRHGLGRLVPEVLGQLLIQPRLLLELQAQVCVAESVYWDRLAAASPAGVSALGPGRERLNTYLAAQKVRPAAPRRRWYSHPALISLATAAVVLVAVGLWSHVQPTGPTGAAAWGWNRADAMPENVPAEQYLIALADTAGQWFNKRPTQSLEVAARIIEFRQGCSRVMLGDHKPLPAVNRQWLKDKCRLWADKLDHHLAALEAGTDPLTVRQEVDETVNKLMTALRGRAKEPHAG